MLLDRINYRRFFMEMSFNREVIDEKTYERIKCLALLIKPEDKEKINVMFDSTPYLSAEEVAKDLCITTYKNLIYECLKLTDETDWGDDIFRRDYHNLVELGIENHPFSNIDEISEVYPSSTKTETSIYALAEKITKTVARASDKEVTAVKLLKRYGMATDDIEIVLMMDKPMPLIVFKDDTGLEYDENSINELKESVSKQLYGLFTEEDLLRANDGRREDENGYGNPRGDGKERTDNYSNPLLRKGVSNYLSPEKKWNGREPMPWSVKGAWDTFGFVDFLSHKVRNPTELAQMFSIYRNPMIEYFHIVLLKKGKIVKQLAMTSGLSAIARTLPKGGMLQLREDLKSVDYDSAYIIHNHPSGDVTPSKEDIGATGNFVKHLFEDKFKGHIILDHDRYTFLEVDRENKRIFGGERPYYPHKIPTRNVMSSSITSDEDVAYEYSRSHQKGTVLFDLSNEHKILNIRPFDVDSFNSKEFIDEMRMSFIRNRIIVTDDANDYQKLYELADERELPILDVVLVNGIQVVSMKMEGVLITQEWQTMVAREQTQKYSWNKDKLPEQGFLFEPGFHYGYSDEEELKKAAVEGYNTASYTKENIEVLEGLMEDLDTSMEMPDKEEFYIPDFDTFRKAYDGAMMQIELLKPIWLDGVNEYEERLTGIGFEPKDKDLSFIGYFGICSPMMAHSLIKEMLSEFKDERQGIESVDSLESWERNDNEKLSDLKTFYINRNTPFEFDEDDRKMVRLIDHTPSSIKTVGAFDEYWNAHIKSLRFADDMRRLSSNNLEYALMEMKDFLPSEYDSFSVEDKVDKALSEYKNSYFYDSKTKMVQENIASISEDPESIKILADRCRFWFLDDSRDRSIDGIVIINEAQRYAAENILKKFSWKDEPIISIDSSSDPRKILKAGEVYYLSDFEKALGETKNNFSISRIDADKCEILYSVSFETGSSQILLKGFSYDIKAQMHYRADIASDIYKTIQRKANEKANSEKISNFWNETKEKCLPIISEIKKRERVAGGLEFI